MASDRFQYSYPEGDVYTGAWSKDGHKHGQGELRFADGTVYQGRFKEGYFNGYGTLIFHDGSIYEGEFLNGKFHGYGIYKRSDNMRFQGRFQDGRVNGPGLVTFPDGSNGRPKNEGIFEGTRLIRRENVPDAIAKAEKSAERARAIRRMDDQDYSVE